MTNVSVDTGVEWKELMNSYQLVRESLEGEINGILLLKATLAHIAETNGFENESSF